MPRAIALAMAFTSESARFALSSRGGKAYVRNHRERGFPTLVKAREVRLAKHQARLAALLAELETGVHCKCCSLRKLS